MKGFDKTVFIQNLFYSMFEVMACSMMLINLQVGSQRAHVHCDIHKKPVRNAPTYFHWLRGNLCAKYNTGS